MNNKHLFGLLAVIIISGAAVVVYGKMNGTETPGTYDSFAQCLTQKGAIFYGAFWCSHCQNQKRMFGSSVEYVPYVECSTPDGRNMLDACKSVGIKSFPTWVFADGTRQEGEAPLSRLAEKTGCELPQTVN
jgi:hypothetical protein